MAQQLAGAGGRVKARVTPASSKKVVAGGRVNLPGFNSMTGQGQNTVRQPVGTNTVLAPPAKRGPATTAPKMLSGAGAASGAAYSGGSLAAGPTGLIAETMAPPAQPLGFDEWKGDENNLKDSSYLSEVASADSEYQNMLDQLTQQNASYRQGLGSTFKNMGLKAQGEDWGNGTWDSQDQLGAYGQSYRGLENDYSGRGLLDSTFYGEATQDLNDRFNRQKDELLTQLTQTNNEFGTNKNAAASSRNSARDRAMAEAYQRYAAGFGV